MKDFILGDCMEGMKGYPDNYFDLAIVDPPYGKTDIACGFGAGSKKRNRRKTSQDIRGWGKPDKKYFTELMRVSKNQIIWGGNYFIEHLRSTNCFIAWDKKNGNSPYADFELAWTSFNKVCKKFELFWLGAHIHRVEDIIHLNQKPVALYKWLLRNYAKNDFKVLSTHVGSASDLIAFEDFGCEYVGYEIDQDYYNAALKRLNQHKAQLTIF